MGHIGILCNIICQQFIYRYIHSHIHSFQLASILRIKLFIDCIIYMLLLFVCNILYMNNSFALSLSFSLRIHFTKLIKYMRSNSFYFPTTTKKLTCFFADLNIFHFYIDFKLYIWHADATDGKPLKRVQNVCVFLPLERNFLFLLAKHSL